MERSATKAAIRPLFPAGETAKKSYDARVLFISACIGIGAVVAISALTVSGAIDPGTFNTMVAFP
jgi:hypothetical protein